MREQFWFVVRTLAATFVMLLILQIKIDGVSLEKRTSKWFHNSAAMVPLQSVVDGGVRITRESWQATVNFLGGQQSKVRSTLKSMKFERQSKAPEVEEQQYKNEDLD